MHGKCFHDNIDIYIDDAGIIKQPLNFTRVLAEILYTLLTLKCIELCNYPWRGSDNIL